MTAGTVERTFSIIDISGFTALTETHGDSHAADMATMLTALTLEALGTDDELVKTLGDAVLLASRAPADALEVVRQVVAACAEVDLFPLVRAGIHHGEAVARGGDYFGNSVNLAARVAAQAAGAQVLATGEVADTARTNGVPVHDVGTHTLRNIGTATPLWEVVLHERSGEWATDPVCRMTINRKHAYASVGDPRQWFCSAHCLRIFVERDETDV